jgi:hypothetical protein
MPSGSHEARFSMNLCEEITYLTSFTNYATLGASCLSLIICLALAGGNRSIACGSFAVAVIGSHCHYLLAYGYFVLRRR